MDVPRVRETRQNDENESARQNEVQKFCFHELVILGLRKLAVGMPRRFLPKILGNLRLAAPGQVRMREIFTQDT